MGKTISITIPQPLEEELRNEAKKQGMSRSRFIGNILMSWSRTQNENSLYYTGSNEKVK